MAADTGSYAGRSQLVRLSGWGPRNPDQAPAGLRRGSRLGDLPRATLLMSAFAHIGDVAGQARVRGLAVEAQRQLDTASSDSRSGSPWDRVWAPPGSAGRVTELQVVGGSPEAPGQSMISFRGVLHCHQLRARRGRRVTDGRGRPSPGCVDRRAGGAGNPASVRRRVDSSATGPRGPHQRAVPLLAHAAVVPPRRAP